MSDAWSRAGAAALAGLGAVVALAACDVPPGTTAMAHESPPSWDAPSDSDPPVMARLTFSSYLGGSGTDEITAIAASGGASPRVVVAGGTASSNFPTTDGSHVDLTAQAGCSGCPYDAFVTRLAGPGQVVWSTVIGGPGYERATAVAIDGELDVFVGGSAATLPATLGAADPTFGGGTSAERGLEDGFVCRLDGATGAAEWCTFIGGSGTGGVLGLEADWAGDDVLVVLNTAAGEDLHLDSAYAAAFAGRHRSTAAGADTVVLRLDGTGQSFQWATYVGGSGDESGVPSVDLDGGGVHVLTTTASTDAPTPNGRITVAPPGRNAYLAALSSDATTLRYGTYLGGNGDDSTGPHALVADGVDFVGVSTMSNDMPIANGAQPLFGGSGSIGCGPGEGDGWVGMISTGAAGSASLLASTYVGGDLGESISGVAKIQPTGELVVTGRTYSSDFPTTGTILPYQASQAGSPCTTTPGNADGFVIRFGGTPFSQLSQRYLSTYLGGAAADELVAVATGENGFYIAAGTSASTDYPRFAELQAAGGGSDGVITTPTYWLPPIAGGDGGPGSDAADPAPDSGVAVDAPGSGFDEGGGGCCGAGAGSTSTPLALLVLASLCARRRRSA